MLLCIRCIDHIIIAKVRRINPHQEKHRILLGIRQIRSQRKIWLIIRLDCPLSLFAPVAAFSAAEACD